MTNLTPVSPEFEPDSWNFLKRYLNSLKKLLIRPSEFFKVDWERYTVSSALAFALVTDWMGVGLQALYSNLMEIKGFDFFDRFQNSTLYHSLNVNQVSNVDSFQNWAKEMGSVMLSPFRTLFAILFLSFFIFLAVKIFVRDSYHARYTKVVKLIAFTYAGSALLFIPVIGPFIGRLVSLMIAIAGVREIYQTTSGTALLIVLFPSLLALILVLGLIFLIFSLLAGALLFTGFG